MKSFSLLFFCAFLAGCGYNDRVDNAKCSMVHAEGSPEYARCREQLEQARAQSLDNYFTPKDPSDPNAKCTYNGLFSKQCEPSSGW